jgi:hypothetical protein
MALAKHHASSGPTRADRYYWHQDDQLDRVLEHRSTSVAADEPLCIATLTRISVEEVLKAGYDVEVRMAKVWQLIANKYGKLPQGILRLAYPRLTVKGFQWAPRTLLREISNKIWDTRPARWMSQKFGILSEQGFERHCRRSTDIEKLRRKHSHWRQKLT